MESGKKWFWFGVMSLAIGFYTTFIIQNLWNWFAVTAFNIPSISYWKMYGLVLLTGLIFGRRDDWAEEHYREGVVMYLEACVPEEKRPGLEAAFKEKIDFFWTKLGLTVLGKVADNTLILAIGFGVHSFLV